MKAIALLVLGAAAAVLAAPRADPPQPADLCDLCKQVVSQLGDEQTMTQVEEALDSVCDIVPHFLHDTCSDFTGQLKDQLEDIAESDPADACEQVGLCPEEPEQPKPAAGNGFVCEACKWTWTTIEQSGPTADQLKEQLETVCQMSPPEMKDQCDEAIAQIVEQYTQGIKKSPQDTCADMQLCDQPQPKPTASSTAAPAPTTTNHVEAIVRLFTEQMATRKQLKAGN